MSAKPVPYRASVERLLELRPVRKESSGRGEVPMPPLQSPFTTHTPPGILRKPRHELVTCVRKTAVSHKHTHTHTLDGKDFGLKYVHVLTLKLCFCL